jgi:uncharacterized protein
MTSEEPMIRWSPDASKDGGFAPAAAQTHISLLFFAGDRAYKLKKQVQTAFLDFSTPELRKKACEREVELNRRFAPDVYLGVADVLGPDGVTCDHLVVMRRMPTERRLSSLTQSGELQGCLEAIADVVAGFHSRSPTGPEISSAGSRDAVLGRWEENIDQIERFAPLLPEPSLLKHIAELAHKYLAGRKPLFDRRIAEGHVRDGHGDLLADDIYCLDDGPRILDCLEFDDRLRYVDVLDDASFLAMDLERLGGPEVGARFLRAYQEASGENHPDSLAHHYMAYRAHVRAKVACLRNEQGDPNALAEAIELLNISARHLEGARVVLVLIGGLPGTGKSTVAREIGLARGWAVLQSDQFRIELTGVPAATHEDAGYRQGIYTKKMTDKTYGSLLSQARELLQLGTSVILDASWSSAGYREDASVLANECRADQVMLRCEAPEHITHARIVDRMSSGTDPSDATPRVAGAMAAEFDPWPEAAIIETSRGLHETLERARLALEASLNVT